MSDESVDLDVKSASDDTKEYLDYLKEANETDLQSLERCECVRSSVDNNGNPVLYFLPRLGFIKSQAKSESQLRQMLLLFLKVAHDIVNKSDDYSIVYGHVQLSILSQQPLIFKYWQMLPRRYKKSLKKLYVLHPRMGIKLFFELSRVFVSTKFYNKLQYVESIAEFENYISPSVDSLPLAYIKFEDEANGLKPSGVMPPLELSFDSSIGTTPLISSCYAYLRSANAVTRQGIFRIAGSDIALTLAKIRLQYDKVYDANTYNTSSSARLIIIGEKGREGYASASSKRSSHGKKGDVQNSLSSIFIDDVDTVAQILRMSLRDLKDPLISVTAHASFVEITNKLVDDPSQSDSYSTDDWEWDANMILDQMKEENKVTLANLLDFIVDFAHHSKENLMDFKNLAVSFTPSLMKFAAKDPMSAMMELTIGQKIMQLLLRKVYKEKFGNNNSTVFDLNSMRFSEESDQSSSRVVSVLRRNGISLPVEQVEENEDIERLSFSSETSRTNRKGVNLTRRPDSLSNADDIPTDDGDEKEEEEIVVEPVNNRRGMKLSKDEMSAVARESSANYG